MLGRRVLEPSTSRRPQYDSLDPSGRFYRFACIECHAETTVDLDEFLRSGRQIDEMLPKSTINAAVRDHWEFNLVGKSHDGGWPRLQLLRCSRCPAAYLLYAGIREPSNARYLVTLQGITEWREE